MRVFLQSFALACLILVVAGCGSVKRTTVSGKVSLKNGSPLPGGAIQFVLASDTKITGGGQIKPDGTYEVTTAPMGECKVVIDNSGLAPSGSSGMPPGMPMGGKAPADASKKMTGPPGGGTALPGGSGSGMMAGAKFVPINKNFSSIESTPLKSTVGNKSATPADFTVE